MRIFDCEPTLNDSQVIDFCKNGFLMLEDVVSEEINRRTLEYVDANPSGQPTGILLEDWFDHAVIKNPAAAGAVRSLLGQDFALPNLMANHRVELPGPAQEWHFDGGSQWGPELNYLQVFYYPQECTLEMGPTELLPGSHFLFSPRQGFMGHYGGIRGAYRSAARAGSIFITVYNIWHRRSASTASGVRNNLKYNYWRTVPPKRDWVHEPGFDIATADFGITSVAGPSTPTFRTQFQDSYDCAEMFCWMLGKSAEFKRLGGQGWPMPPHNWLDKPYGVPVGLIEE